MKRFACLAIPFALVACGDNNPVTQPIDAPVSPDSAPIDAQPIDAPVDAPDGPPPVTYSGTVSMLEAAVLNPGTSGTFFGQGVQIGISFNASDGLPGPVLEETPGSPFGCKAWIFDRNQAIQSSLGIDEGPVQINTPIGTSPYPACGFQAGAGYLCPETATAGAGGTIAAGPLAMTAKLTVTGTPFTAANSTNRYVNIRGATSAANNGTFPILTVLDAGATIVYGNPAFVAEALPSPAGTHVNLAGIGPTPGAVDPGFLTDVQSAEFVHTAGAHIAAFTSTTTAAGSIGDDFALDIADANRLNALPRDGTAFTVSCGTGSCLAGSASGALINIVTTNGTPAAGNPFDMPLPAATNGRRVQIRCAQLGVTTITVPAAFSAFLTPAMTNTATRIQATFIRPTLMGSGPSTVNSIAGHAIVGFTN